MNIQDFSELTTFVYNEFEKISESCGLQNSPDKLLNRTIKTIDKYVKLYNSKLFNREKRELELKDALLTMPHNWLWKFFHRKLWKKMQLILNEKKEGPKQPPSPPEPPTSTAVTVCEISQPVAYVPPQDDN